MADIKNPIDFSGDVTPLMDPDERDFMFNNILKRSVTMLEYGSGGSTIEFPRRVKKYYSIEHHPEWHERIGKDSGGCENLTLILEEDRKKYVEVPQTLGEMFDIILVDGISRLECALFSFDYLKDDGILLVHDAGELIIPGFNGTVHELRIAARDRKTWRMKKEFNPLLEKYYLDNSVLSLFLFKKN